MSFQSVGRYEVIGELGRGAMGVVYKAQDPTIGRTVAMKTMRLDTHGLETEDMLRRFKNEARAAGLLNHPNIVTIYDAGEQDGMFYIAMEFIEGTTLHSVLGERRVLPTEEAIGIAREICKGLDYAHSHGIIHRDIKPANIMITPKGAVKIMDFGIAKAGGGMTSTGQVLGTPNYMSPEQVKGKTLDGRSDLFSFGVILYEMITGEKPFIGQNVTTIIYKIVHENPIAPRDLDVTIHPGLSAVVTKALAKDPAERYQSGAELMRDLENYKSIGSTQSPTAVLSATALRQADRTQSLAAGATSNGAPKGTSARPAAPAATRSLTSTLRNRKIAVLEIVVVATLILLAVLGGYSYYGLRTARRLHDADMELERKIQDQQIQQAAAAATLRAAENAVPDPASSAPDATAAESPEKRAAKPLSSPNTAVRNQGELRFTSQPSGAKVEIDGWSEPSWVTPFKASHLAAGQHSVVFSRPGYVDVARNARVTAGQTLLITGVLNSAPSILSISSTPTGARITVDGQDTGKVTPAQITAGKGDHKVVLSKPGFKDDASTQTLADGQTLNYSPALQAQPPLAMEEHRPTLWRRALGINEPITAGKGVVHIRTLPEGASIQVGNRMAGKRTPVRWEVEPGTYQVTLRIDGYKPVTRTVRVQNGKASDLDEILQKQP